VKVGSRKKKNNSLPPWYSRVFKWSPGGPGARWITLSWVELFQFSAS